MRNFAFKEREAGKSSSDFLEFGDERGGRGSQLQDDTMLRMSTKKRNIIALVSLLLLAALLGVGIYFLTRI
jgi:hypothetical protein